MFYAAFVVNHLFAFPSEGKSCERNLFYQPGIPQGIHHLDREESHHAIRVLRMSEGQNLDLTDGQGFFYVARITKADPKKSGFEILEKRQGTKRDFHIHIAIAPTKNSFSLFVYWKALQHWRTCDYGLHKITAMILRRQKSTKCKCARVGYL